MTTDRMTGGERLHLPDLPPDVQFAALPRDERAFAYTFDVKRAAMRPYIETRWGWDEALQRRLHRERFDEKPFTRIVWRERAVGTVSLMRFDTYVRFGEFYLRPEYPRTLSCHPERSEGSHRQKFKAHWSKRR